MTERDEGEVAKSSASVEEIGILGGSFLSAFCQLSASFLSHCWAMNCAGVIMLA